MPKNLILGPRSAILLENCVLFKIIWMFWLGYLCISSPPPLDAWEF